MSKQVCWWCCYPPDGDFLHLPYKYDEKNKQMLTMGNFCSWGCMKAYNFSVNTTVRIGVINSLINMFYRQHTGKLGKIEKAPDKYVLDIFGGTYSIEEFRKTSELGNPILNYPNQIYQIQNIIKPERITFKEPTTGDINSKMSSISKTPGKGNETLKLKRPTPLKRDLNNLELSMGIKRVSKQN